MQRAESKKKNWNLRDCVRDNHIHMYSVHTHPISDAYHLREVWKKVKWNIKKGKLFCVSAHKSRYVYYRIHRFTVHKQYEERSSSFSASIVSLEICGDMYSQFTHKIARWWQWDGWEGDGGWVVEQQATSNNVCNINTWLLDNFTSYIFYVAVANSLSLSLSLHSFGYCHCAIDCTRQRNNVLQFTHSNELFHLFALAAIFHSAKLIAFTFAWLLPSVVASTWMNAALTFTRQTFFRNNVMNQPKLSLWNIRAAHRWEKKNNGKKCAVCSTLGHFAQFHVGNGSM